MSSRTVGERHSYSQAVAAELRATLARRGLTGVVFARMTGVTQSYVSVRMRGVVALDMHDLERFAGALGVEPAELLPRNWVKPSPPPPGGGDAGWAPRGSNPQPADYKFYGSRPGLTHRDGRRVLRPLAPARPAAARRPQTAAA